MRKLLGSVYIPDFLYKAIPILSVVGGLIMMFGMDCSISKTAGLVFIIYGGYILAVRC